MFLMTRDGFLNHCPMKSFVICQLDMFTFVVSHTTIFSVNREKREFWIFGDGTQNGGQFSNGGTKLVVRNGATWDRFYPRAKILRKQNLKILNFEFCLSFKSVPG